ncbi:MAG: hypothetical protein QOF89_2854 [Acidobacteriota bacterium]|jgi:hypothetical protein|nr:hypothetical protein [Acidobacteriota bacterium]
MIPIWLYQIPTFWLGFLIIGFFVLIAVAGLWLTRPLAKRISRSENDFANYYIAVVAVVYAVLVGLIAAASWANYTAVQALVSAEATSVSDLYRDVEAYPPALRDQLRGMLRQYVHHVITEEWPAQRRGVIPRTHTEMVRRLSAGWTAFEPTTPGQQIAHAECLHQLDELLTNRRQRLDAVDSNLPDLMWAVVLFGAVIAIAMTFLFWTESWAFHVFLTTAFAVTLGLVIFLIVELDRPLVGSVSVPATSFQELEDVMGPG